MTVWTWFWGVVFLGLGVTTVQGEHGALVLPVAQAPEVEAGALCRGAHPAWNSALDSKLQWNRTPPLYASDPVDDGTRPVAAVRLLRMKDGSVAVRLRWTDSTRNETGSGARFPDGGESHIYPVHNTATDAFCDAACVMVPKTRGAHAIYPSLMMGQADQPVDLYYWRAGAGFELLGAHGRATTASTETAVIGDAARSDGEWTVTFAVPNLTAGTPICFAVWDGAQLHRDGLKYFSLWYEVQ